MAKKSAYDQHVAAGGKLNDRIVRALKASDAAVREGEDGKSYRVHAILWDSEVHGLGIRVTPSGNKAFILNYRVGRKMRRITIGEFPTKSTESAREAAKKLRHTIDNGGDPLGNKEASREAPTFQDLTEHYVEQHLPKNRPSSARNNRQMIDNILLPKLGKRTVAEITFKDISDIHHKITKAKHPYRANRVVALLSKMFSIAIKLGWRADNPAKGIERNEEKPRDRYLTDDELARLAKTLDAWSDQHVANVIRLLLYTGARRGEILGAEWRQFDLVNGTWTKPSAHTKTKKPHKIPLSPEAVAVLEKMQAKAKARQSISPYLFPSRNGGHRVDLKKVWPAICEAADIKDLRVHDLRHSFASILVAGGASLPMIGKLLGHTQVATTQRYAHLDVDPLRELVAKVGAVVDRADKVGRKVVRGRFK